jgi:hypothetical protein
MPGGRYEAMSLVAPPPVELEELDDVVERPIGRPPKGNGHNGHGGRPTGGNGSNGGAEEEPYQPPTKSRRSIWPFLLDLGLVMMLFGWIIIGQFLVVIGAVIFVVALAGWIRAARADFSNLRD